MLSTLLITNNNNNYNKFICNSNRIRPPAMMMPTDRHASSQSHAMHIRVFHQLRTAFYVANPKLHISSNRSATACYPGSSNICRPTSKSKLFAQQQTAAAAGLAFNNPNNPPQQTAAAATAYGGTTHFVPPPAQATSRPVSLPQRRPTNAIHLYCRHPKRISNKNSGIETDDSKSSSNQPPIDQLKISTTLLTNMFVQRPAFQPPPATTATTPTTTNPLTKSSTATTDAPTLAADSSNNIQSNMTSQDNPSLE
ncbi:hypothetical protein EVAR_71725_1 [Eumeta japonica]|uniref:Uncharacterized protein n=1 Tax=Eumeta variegata TaxID=151549 RepID=A0A4C1T6W5_EUMVA|nr:hypothetical protein EVAR_71725_1 [Eumeta japonica]